MFIFPSIILNWETSTNENIYGLVQQYKTKEERLSVLSIHKRKLDFLLSQGYDPIDDNSEFYLKKNEKSSK